MPLLNPDQAEALASVVRDPARFTRALLGHDLWPVQEAILRSVARNRRTAVKACHSSGKTFTAADAALWWITRYDDGIVITTAPTWNQVERVLWAYIHQTIQQARDRIRFPVDPLKTEIRLGPNRYAIGLSTNDGVRFQGFHGRILIILDEAPGVLPGIWEAIEGIRAGGDVRLLALGNPTIAGGPFYDAFGAERAGWNTITISAFDTPNLAGLSIDGLLALSDDELDNNVRPYLTTRRWVHEKYHEWGPGHPLWQARVMGQFPDQAEDALIPLAWLEEAKRRPARDPGGKATAGIDVAGPGEDETVVCIRCGSSILALKAFNQPDARGEVAAFLAGWSARLGTVNIDTVGIGHYFAEHIRSLGYHITRVNVGEAPRDREKYSNLKAELFWGLRQRFQQEDLAGLTDEVAIAQLTTLRYEHNARGQVVIESKEDMRKRGVKSPDRAEAIMLAFAERQARITWA